MTSYSGPSAWRSSCPSCLDKEEPGSRIVPVTSAFGLCLRHGFTLRFWVKEKVFFNDTHNFMARG